jgi:hypothetical protein
MRHEIPGLKVILPVIGEAGWGFWAAAALVGIPAAVVAVGFAEGRVRSSCSRPTSGPAALLRLAGLATSWLRLVEAIAIGALLVRLVIAANE